MNEMDLFAMGGGLPQGVHQYYGQTYNPAYPTPHGYAKGGKITSAPEYHKVRNAEYDRRVKSGKMKDTDDNFERFDEMYFDELVEKGRINPDNYFAKGGKLFDKLFYVKNLFSKDVQYKTEDGYFKIIIKPLKEDRKYGKDFIGDEVFYKVPENELTKDEVGLIFVESSNIWLEDSPLEVEDIEEKFGVRLSKKAKSIYTDTKKAKTEKNIKDVKVLSEMLKKRNITPKQFNAMTPYQKKSILTKQFIRGYAKGGLTYMPKESGMVDYFTKKPILKDERWVVYFKDKGKPISSSIKIAKSKRGAERINSRLVKSEEFNNNDYTLLMQSMDSFYKEYPKLFAKGGKTQGYNDKLDESLGNTKGKRSTKEQNYKDRRNESEAMEKKGGKRKYASVKTMDKGNRKKRQTPMSLAKEIRKEGEKWQDAVKRASAMLKKK